MYDQELKKALFSDTTSEYLTPEEPAENEMLEIKLRVARELDAEVSMICNGNRVPMVKKYTEGCFDYYSCNYQLSDERITYYFEIRKPEAVFYYDVRGVVEETEESFHFRVIPGFSTPKWAKGAVFYQIYVDRFYNGDPSNDVLTGEYKYNGHLVTGKSDWNSYTSNTGIGEFYGGDLAGVLKKMDYLQELGVEVIYFNPLFVSPSNHKYDIQDYDHIDPHFGKIVHDEGYLLTSEIQENRVASRYIDRVTNWENLEASDKLFIQVVQEAHRRGMKVILDGVFNHCGSFNKWLDREHIYENVKGQQKGAFITGENEYRDFFYFAKDKWPDNESYEGWWGYDTLPKLNYESEHLYEYIMKIARKWVSEPFCADGWRLDVAADLGKTPELNHQFWKDFRRNVKEANPSALILAEHYGDPSPWMNGKEWDSVMNYDAFMEPVTWFLTGMQKHSDAYDEEMLNNTEAFWQSMYHYRAKFTNSSLSVAMNELSNHDHSRFLTRTNHIVGRVTTNGPRMAEQSISKAVMREAVLIQMTWQGAPTIYYGDEAGVCGFTDPDNRRTYPWGMEDRELIAFHKEAVRIHKENEELRTGSTKRLTCTNVCQTSEGCHASEGCIAYGRMKGKDCCAILINNTQTEQTLKVSVWEMGIPKDAEFHCLLATDADSYQIFTSSEQAGEVCDAQERKCNSVLREKLRVISGELEITLQPTSGMIWKYRG